MQKCDPKCPHRSVQYDKSIHGYCSRYNCLLAMDSNGDMYAVKKCISGNLGKKEERQKNGVVDCRSINNYTSL